MIDILMPRLSDTMTEGAIAAWHKKPGDAVAPGDVLVEIETDKALMEQEAYDAGVLAEILVAEGENVPIGTPIARLDDGTDAGGVGSANPVTADAPEPVADAAAESSASTAPSGEGRRAATPLVRRLARERDIDLAAVAGTGPGGRIVRADLDGLASGASASTVVGASQGASVSAPVPASASAPASPSAPAPASVGVDRRDPEAVPFDAVRQQIAARLTESATTVPTFTATAAVDVTALLDLRGRLNADLADGGAKISVNDLIVRASALALRAHPGINASYSPEGRGQTLLHGSIHIGIAVASPAGLVVPVIRDVDRSAASTIAAQARDLVERAAARRLTTDDMADGTFTVSNLGMFGIEEFTAIINPPQGAILAVGEVRDEVVLAGDGDRSIGVRKMLRVTLTADHRIIDGALAARFLATLTELLEHPLRVIG
ncbi:MAG: 2-oxo acid dehydrogenase subunit E2 [Microbacterium sp.]|nr:2-oxo acid dehydrogenase subunit E2 [Microbacterium sp.]